MPAWVSTTKEHLAGYLVLSGAILMSSKRYRVLDPEPCPRFISASVSARLQPAQRGLQPARAAYPYRSLCRGQALANHS